MICEHSEIELPRLQSLNEQGLIPGPDEGVDAFIERVEACLQLKEAIRDELKDNIPFDSNDLESPPELENAFEASRRLYGILPQWVPIFFSNRQLAPWHGGCAWIFQRTKLGPRLAFLQLRRELATKERYLKIYGRDELVSHELAHVGRLAYDEGQFEELLAYKASSPGWRRCLGPLLQNSKEAVIFLGLLLLSLVVQIFAAATSTSLFYSLCMWSPIFLLIGLCGRLWWRQRQLTSCTRQLSDISQVPEHLVFRLTDREIRDFGDWNKEKILAYAKRESTRSLRWRLLYHVYFSH